MQNSYATKAERQEWVANWERTIAAWQDTLRQAR